MRDLNTKLWREVGTYQAVAPVLSQVEAPKGQSWQVPEGISAYLLRPQSVTHFEPNRYEPELSTL